MLGRFGSVVAVSMIGSFAHAGGILDYTATLEDLTIEGVGNVATANTLNLSGYRILDNNLALTGDFSYTTGSVLGLTLSGTSLSLGAGYALSNNLDMANGTGSTTVINAQFELTRLEVDDIGAADGGTAVGLTGNIALGSGVVAEYTFSSPTDSLGNTISYSGGISWLTNFIGEVRLGLVGGQSIVDGVDIDTTGWYLGSVTRFQVTVSSRVVASVHLTSKHQIPLSLSIFKRSEGPLPEALLRV